MELEQRFRNDNDVRAALGNHPYATQQFISTITPHKQLAESLLLDPSAARGRGQSPLSVEHIAMTAEDARRAAQDVRDATLQPRARSSTPAKHSFVFPNEPGVDRTEGTRSNLSIQVFQYSVPVAYKALGLLVGRGSNNEKQYAVRVVWERHSFAKVSGRIIRVGNQFTPRDGMIVGAIQQLQGKRALQAGGPLPIADFLAQATMQAMNVHIGSLQSLDQLPDNVRDILLCDEIETDIDVVDSVELRQQQQSAPSASASAAALVSSLTGKPVLPSAIANEKRAITKDDVEKALQGLAEQKKEEEDEEDEEEEEEITVSFRDGKKK